MLRIRTLLNRFNGLHYPQDYLCIAHEQFQHTLQVYAMAGSRILKNVTSAHLFVGYSPLIIALPPFPGCTRLVFTSGTLQPNDYFQEKDALASLLLSPLLQYAAHLSFYRAEWGKHRFQPAWQQYVQAFYNRRYNNKPGNVFLPGNLFRQVQIAYAVPRNISLITVGSNGLYNLFPTDLHGDAGNDTYVVSLRHSGKACKQVMRSGQVLLSSVEPHCYKEVYALGRNHMQELKKAGDLPFGRERSATFRLPVPGYASSWRELELEDSFVHGIHRLLIFKSRYQQPVPHNAGTLSHLHNSYASWLYNKGLAGNYLMR